MSTAAVKKSKTRELVLCGLLTALVFVSTRFINIRLPISVNGGLIHMGNTMLFMIAIIFGKKRGAIAGAFGMGLFDILSGWLLWAPFTFVIRGAMGYIVGYAAEKHANLLYTVLAIIVSGFVMIGGYYVTEGLLYGNWIAPATSIPGNVIQLVIGGALGVPFAEALKKTKALSY
ncbi:MAG: ECF transporter S component [Clostridia bacterium]|nr:ECF transporter S component [Clostridia bacterium]